MKNIIVLMMVVLITSCSGTPYVRAGLGYKYHEMKVGDDYCKSKVSGRVEAGVITEYFIYGWAHHSQPSCGWPANDTPEYFKSELFVDLYKSF